MKRTLDVFTARKTVLLAKQTSSSDRPRTGFEIEVLTLKTTLPLKSASNKLHCECLFTLNSFQNTSSSQHKLVYYKIFSTIRRYIDKEILICDKSAIPYLQYYTRSSAESKTPYRNMKTVLNHH